MTPTQDSLDTLSAFATTLAEKGGAIAKQWFRTDYTIDLKKDKSPVTIADRTVEGELRQQILAAYPSHGILGEEYGQDKTDAEYVWVLDPIDGTRSFITGSPLWGTLVALLHRGQPVVGVVEMPILQERWLGVAGKGSWFSSRGQDQKACTVSRCTRLEEAKFYTTSMRYFDSNEQPAVQHLTDTVQTANFGGDCYIYGLLAAGYIDLVVESQLHPFDYLSLIPIISEAGGCITDWDNQPLSMHSTGKVIAAATPELHRQTLELLHSRL
jgi:histidinol phosphatase-like enzyme (inositol monophosphatase family)